MMNYKGYLGKVEFDDEAAVFHGEVINTRDVITFQGESVAELKQAFQDSINDYLSFCKERGESAEKPFSGQFVTRIPPELHRQATLAASLSGTSLNAWVTEQLREAVQREGLLKVDSRQRNASSKSSRKPEKNPRKSKRKSAG
ncbi:type II toxin-antitoxin system HicB family antitoxin [Gimesia sp.]|uniref:type II toxin-antitoxin system HicB family antitoxin n=1 Tax=uncultured Gimesia sp. TaxID=1678688 RepID=UPI000C43A8E8|nr:type II toxin-antitoxin system HicB family antitoxin [Gimesia sp.]MAX37808.1 toxin-antitoxin system HicB family antitoxin [Gimesia sp.]HAH45193.1 toxin-antitoxin system HicB family antitoxin [Planctomycetaceae bacterium]HBL42023.1 toxin-antitoxin system HicB family antitoxin [Planctomycetaceae bacterium]|tara:strand:+ start:10718 stop:11146 length:429 start_codon:yes stop_codon:yes gene_type:complete